MDIDELLAIESEALNKQWMTIFPTDPLPRGGCFQGQANAVVDYMKMRIFLYMIAKIEKVIHDVQKQYL